VHCRRINLRHRSGDQLPDVGLAAGAGQQPVVTYAMKPVGQNVEQKAPDELVGAQELDDLARILGYIMRTVHSGIVAGVMVPDGLGAASASLARRQAQQNSVYWISSASISGHAGAGRCSPISRWRKPRPIMNSDFARLLVENWCMICGMMPVRL
jgi:hypothetical protein